MDARGTNVLRTRNPDTKKSGNGVATDWSGGGKGNQARLETINSHTPISTNTEMKDVREGQVSYLFPCRAGHVMSLRERSIRYIILNCAGRAGTKKVTKRGT